MHISRYIIGVDLGTTNCALSYVDTKGRERPAPDIRAFEIPQLVAPGETAPRSMLPSFLYLPGPHELPPGVARLPWDPNADRIVGEFARVQGSRVPARLVSSAKSWLCHAGVDREADILPWGSSAEVKKISPVHASAAYLIHLRDAWNASMAKGEEACTFQRQEIILTVPASFDEAARELTLQAAKLAGLDNVVLLEEPQAAFYCWIVTHQDVWQSQVRAGESILVCDVGGGTTDFSLISVVETPTGPGFRRVAVGDHLMLGGDNIDLALAHLVEKKLGGARLDAEQWNALRFACRTAKEKLLTDRNLSERWPVTIAGRGSKLIGASLQSEISLAEVRECVVEGFFPFSPRNQDPNKSSRSGLQEFGLPFVADPAVTRHLNMFLRKHQPTAIALEGFAGDDRPARPDAILFNGGALTPTILRERIVDVVRSWFVDLYPTFAPRVLVNESLDLAVAHGAAYYGVVRRGGGIRIGGGTARSFYVGLDVKTAATPWLCVVPRDAREGDEFVIANRDFELLMGRPVLFPLAASSVRANDRPGDLISGDQDSLRELPPLRTSMRVGRKAKAESVPVRLVARVTEVGTIELWCQSRGDDRRWKLQIQFRGVEERRQPADVNEATRDVIEQAIVDSCLVLVRESFAKSDPHAVDGPERLVKRLEEAFELPRAEWPSSALRALWDPLREAVPDRFKSARHESRWLNLAGYCLRPGVGFPLDEHRIKALWPIFHAGVQFSKDVQCWVEWWVLWRRVAAGLNKAHHDEIFRRIAPFLLDSKTGGGAKKPARQKPESHELAEMWRCAASLERLPASIKESLGETLVKRLSRPNPPSQALWCLGRLGARVPLFAPANTVIGRESVEGWAHFLLGREQLSPREARDAIFALSQLARVSGDRTRDLDETLRRRTIETLTRLGADESMLRPVLEFHELEIARQGEALGDALPVGLRLSSRDSQDV